MSELTNPESMKNTLTIRVRPFIRYLAALIGLVVAFPNLFELATIFFDSKNAPDSIGILISSCLLAGSVFLTWRWLSLSASVSNREIRISKLLRTVKIPVEEFGGVELHGWLEHGELSYYLVSKNGKRLTIVPSTLTLSPQFTEFIKRLEYLSASRLESSQHEKG